MSLTFNFLTLIIIFGMLGVGSALYHSDSTIDIYDYTTQKFSDIYEDMNYSQHITNYKDHNYSSLSDSEISDLQSTRLSNIIFKFADFLTFTLLEISQWSVEFGFNHPQYNYIFYAKVIIGLLALTMISSLLMLAALIYFLIKELISVYHKFRKRSDNGNTHS